MLVIVWALTQMHSSSSGRLGNIMSTYANLIGLQIRLGYKYLIHVTPNTILCKRYEISVPPSHIDLYIKFTFTILILLINLCNLSFGM